MSASRYLPPETIRQVAEANPIEEIIGADLPLRKAGAVLVGLCRFHQEKSPSLTVTPARQRFKCFGCGAGGDVFGYVMARDGVGFTESVRMLAQRGGIPLEDAGTSWEIPVARRPPPKLLAVRQPTKVLTMPPDLRAATRAELQAVAQQRELSVAGLELASRRGLLWFGSPKGLPAWIVTDGARVNAQARRLDGEPWEQIGGAKAWTLRGSRGAWPIGAKAAGPFPSVVLVEGAPDLLAAHHYIVEEVREEDVAAVAMLGATNIIPDEALRLLAGKRIRIFPHVDKAGADAALRWTGQLEGADCKVDAFRFDGLRRADGAAVKDLNDFANLHPDCLAAERAQLSEVLPR